MKKAFVAPVRQSEKKSVDREKSPWYKWLHEKIVTTNIKSGNSGKGNRHEGTEEEKEISGSGLQYGSGIFL